MSETTKMLATGTQGAIAIAGLVLFWRHVASPRARQERPTSLLPPWSALPSDLMLLLLYILAGGFFGTLMGGFLLRALALTGDRAIIFNDAFARFGLLGGVAVFDLTYRARLDLSWPRRPFVLPGLVAFLIAMPFVFLLGVLWPTLLEAVGLPVEKQLAIDLFARMKSLPWLLALGTAAVVVAPVAEELIFRAGIFRFLRTRVPRWAALLLPACLFAAVHVNLASYAQLTFLGVVFAVAYERTGHIGTPIVAHALFNLNMVILLLAGVS